MHSDVNTLPHSILVVEDDPIARLIMLKAIESIGCKVQTATSVAEALACIDRQVFSLILLDAHLSDGGGWEVARHVRNAQTTFRIPIVAISSDDSQESIGKLLNAGVDHFMVKPIHLQQFRSLVAFYLAATL